jgi:hypothetical protein
MHPTAVISFDGEAELAALDCAQYDALVQVKERSRRRARKSRLWRCADIGAMLAECLAARDIAQS